MTPEQRRYLEGLRWESDLPPKISLRERIKGVAEVAIGLLVILFLLAVMQNRDLADKAAAHAATTERYAGMLAQCMNGRALYDKTSNTAFFCSKVVALKF